MNGYTALPRSWTRDGMNSRRFHSFISSTNSLHIKLRKGRCCTRSEAIRISNGVQLLLRRREIRNWRTLLRAPPTPAGEYSFHMKFLCALLGLLSVRIQAANPNLPKSLPQLISASVTSCEPDIRQVLLSNVVLGGGGSLFAGLADRLNNELNRIFNHVGQW